MKNAIKKLLFGASIAVGINATATTPAHAVSFSFNNLSEIKTYTGGSNGVFIANDTVAATVALTDGDASSNVELWYSTENPASNVGFTATEGNYSATISSVTASDWSYFGSQWLSDLLSIYTPFQSVWNGFSDNTKSLVTSYFPLLGMGDPNIGSFQFGQDGGIELKLVGHLDVKTKLSTLISTSLTEKWDEMKAQFPTVTGLPTLSQVNGLISQLQTQLSLATTPVAVKKQLSSKIDQLTKLKDLLSLQATVNAYQGEIAASEIAKVVTGDKIYYAYSFSPTTSGITAADDGVSYSAIYTWNTPGYQPKVPSVYSQSVPEPSLVLGLLGFIGFSGMFAAQRKLEKYKPS
ncbi:MAG: NF038130 family PEP-CTERM protein [Fischerella sp.]|nr:NF038130 family PEP-CTERM protein [Fischerella sp.]